MLQLKQNVSQNRAKLQQTKKKNETNNILQNLKGKSILDKSFFEDDPLDEPSSTISGSWSKTQNDD